jgi:hypothetical protein
MRREQRRAGAEEAEQAAARDAASEKERCVALMAEVQQRCSAQLTAAQEQAATDINAQQERYEAQMVKVREESTTVAALKIAAAQEHATPDINAQPQEEEEIREAPNVITTTTLRTTTHGNVQLLTQALLALTGQAALQSLAVESERAKAVNREQDVEALQRRCVAQEELHAARTLQLDGKDWLVQDLQLQRDELQQMLAKQQRITQQQSDNCAALERQVVFNRDNFHKDLKKAIDIARRHTTRAAKEEV